MASYQISQCTQKQACTQTGKISRRISWSQHMSSIIIPSFQIPQVQEFLLKLKTDTPGLFMTL